MTKSFPNYEQFFIFVVNNCFYSQESLKVKSETHKYLEDLETDLNEQIANLGENPSFSRIVGLLSPSRIQIQK